jgi:hypothetical protein
MLLLVFGVMCVSSCLPEYNVASVLCTYRVDVSFFGGVVPVAGFNASPY